MTDRQGIRHPEPGFASPTGGVLSEPNLLEYIWRHAERAPGAPALTFLSSDLHVAKRLSYAQLTARVGQLARVLEQRTEAGDRALLLFGPGVDFTIALLACFQASVVAVPVPVPGRGLVAGHDKLAPIARSSAASHVLCSSRELSRQAALCAVSPELASLRWLATDSDGPPPGSTVQSARRRLDSTAFLQFTSGSTSHPKGVVVTHQNIIHNEHCLQKVFEHDSNSVMVSWLPHYHDMGLIGGILHPLFVGGHAYLMSPLAFLKRPVRWLQAISNYGATTTAAPDLAYRLCAREVDEREKKHLDLSRLRVAVSGGESVRPETIREFYSAFKACGLSPRALRPSYGLAESTLMVSASPLGSTARTVHFDREELEQGRAVPCSATTHSTELASCGPPVPGTRIAIVNAATGLRCLPDEVGEVWIESPSVAKGYYYRPDATRASFGSRLETDDARTYCRTGDLGFMRDGELFVAGRLKDVIIVNGRNHHPEDIERTVESACPTLGAALAFSHDLDGRERVVIVAETRRSMFADGMTAASVQRTIGSHVLAHHGLDVHEVRLVPAGGIPRTSSGKVRRHECKTRWLHGQLRTSSLSALGGASQTGA